MLIDIKMNCLVITVLNRRLSLVLQLPECTCLKLEWNSTLHPANRLLSGMPSVSQRKEGCDYEHLNSLIGKCRNI